MSPGTGSLYFPAVLSSRLPASLTDLDCLFMLLSPSVPGRDLDTGVGRVQVGCMLMVGWGGRSLFSGLTMPQRVGSDLGTKCSQRGGCSLPGRHLLTMGWGSGPMGRGRLISSLVARALHFHFCNGPCWQGVNFKDCGSGENFLIHRVLNMASSLI